MLNRTQRAFKRKTFRKSAKRTFKRVPRTIRAISDLRCHQKMYQGFTIDPMTAVVTPDTLNTAISINTSSNADNTLSFGIGFALADVPSYMNFVDLFDRFRIKSVQLRIIPQFNTYQSVTPNNQIVQQGSQLITYDWDDNNAPNSRTSMMNREKLKIHNVSREITYKIHPRVAVDSDNLQAVLQVSPWLNTSANTTVHNGIKYMVASATNTNANAVPVTHVGFYLDYELEFKDVYSS